MDKRLSKYKKLLLVFQKHDVLDCYSLSYGKETYEQEVKYLMKKVKKTHDYNKVKQLVSDMFNEFLELTPNEQIQNFSFQPEDFEELSEDIFKVYQGMVVDLNATDQDRLRCEELHYQILSILEELEKPLKELEKELDLGDGFDFETLSYPELDYLISKLSNELNELEAQETDDEPWKVDEE